MNRHETNKANMGAAVAALFDEENEILTEFTVLAQPVAKLKTILAEIGTVDKKYIFATGGKTSTKLNAEEELLEDLMPVKNALYGLANKTGNQALKNLTGDSESGLKKMRDADFLKRAEAVHEAAVNNLADLDIYKITAPVLAELKEKIDGLSLAIGGQDTGYADRSALRKQLSSKFDELDLLLYEELDNLIELLRKSNKLFYDKYFSARGIRDLGGGRKTIEGNGVKVPAEQPK